MTLHVGVDIDGVLADFDTQFRTTYQQWFDREHKAPAGTWDVLTQGTHFKDLAEAFAWVASVPGFWLRMPPVRGAQGGIYNMLRTQGHRISLVSTRATPTRAETQAWLMAMLPTDNVLPPLQLVPSGLKGTIDCQVYIEDSPFELESLRGKPCVLIFDQPWNKDVETGKGLHRVRGWGEVLEFLHVLEHGSEVPFLKPEVQRTARRVAHAGDK